MGHLTGSDGFQGACRAVSKAKIRNFGDNFA
jgi:hypothetical protein